MNISKPIRFRVKSIAYSLALGFVLKFSALFSLVIDILCKSDLKNVIFNLFLFDNKNIFFHISSDFSQCHGTVS